MINREEHVGTCNKTYTGVQMGMPQSMIEDSKLTTELVTNKGIKQCSRRPGALLSTWINLNPSMDM